MMPATTIYPLFRQFMEQCYYYATRIISSNDDYENYDEFNSGGFYIRDSNRIISYNKYNYIGVLGHDGRILENISSNSSNSTTTNDNISNATDDFSMIHSEEFDDDRIQKWEMINEILPRIAGLITVTCSVCMLVMASKRIDRLFHRLALGMSIHLLIQGVTRMVGTAAVPSEFSGDHNETAMNASGTVATCTLTGFLEFFCANSAMFYYAIGFSIYSSVVTLNDFDESRYLWIEPYLHVGVHLYPFCAAIAILAAQAFNNTGFGYCGVASSPLNCVNEPDIECIRGPDTEHELRIYQGLDLFCDLLVVFFPTVVMTALTICVYQRNKITSSTGVGDILISARTVLIQTLIYLVPMIITAIPFVIERIIEIITENIMQHNLMIIGNALFSFFALFVLLMYMYFTIPRKKHGRHRNNSNLNNNKRLSLCARICPCGDDSESGTSGKLSTSSKSATADVAENASSKNQRNDDVAKTDASSSGGKGAALLERTESSLVSSKQQSGGDREQEGNNGTGGGGGCDNVDTARTAKLSSTKTLLESTHHCATTTKAGSDAFVSKRMCSISKKSIFSCRASSYDLSKRITATNRTTTERSTIHNNDTTQAFRYGSDDNSVDEGFDFTNSHTAGGNNANKSQHEGGDGIAAVSFATGSGSNQQNHHQQSPTATAGTGRTAKRKTLYDIFKARSKRWYSNPDSDHQNQDATGGGDSNTSNNQGLQRQESSSPQRKFSFNIFDGTNAKGTYADFIYDGDSDDLENDNQETLQWSAVQDHV